MNASPQHLFTSFRVFLGQSRVHLRASFQEPSRQRKRLVAFLVSGLLLVCCALFLLRWHTLAGPEARTFWFVCLLLSISTASQLYDVFEPLQFKKTLVSYDQNVALFAFLAVLVHPLVALVPVVLSAWIFWVFSGRIRTIFRLTDVAGAVVSTLLLQQLFYGLSSQLSGAFLLALALAGATLIAFVVNGWVGFQLFRRVLDGKMNKYEFDRRMIVSYLFITLSTLICGYVYFLTGPISSAILLVVLAIGSMMVRFLFARLHKRLGIIRPSWELAGLTFSILHEREPRFMRHGIAVGRLSELVGRRAGLSEAECKELWLAGVFHDIGLAGAPQRTLRFAERVEREAPVFDAQIDGEEVELPAIDIQNPVTDEDVILLEQHTDVGARLLATLPRLATIVRLHHERINGSGLPYGLTQEHIPLQSQIIAVVETYELIASTSSYYGTVSKDRALSYLYAKIGFAFDSCLVHLLEEVLDDHDVAFQSSSDIDYDREVTMIVPRLSAYAQGQEHNPLPAFRVDLPQSWILQAGKGQESDPAMVGVENKTIFPNLFDFPASTDPSDIRRDHPDDPFKDFEDYSDR